MKRASKPIIKLVYSLSLLSMLSFILSFLTHEINPLLAQVLFFMGIGFWSLGLFLAVIYVISLFKRSDVHKDSYLQASDEVKALEQRKDVHVNPYALINEMYLLLFISLALFSGLGFAFFVWVLHVTSVTPVDLFASIALNFLFGVLFSMTVLPRVGLFKEVKPGEVKVVKVPPELVRGGKAMSVPTLSRRSFFKGIIFISDYPDESLVKKVEAHETAHVREHHPIFFLTIAIFLVSATCSLMYFAAFSNLNPFITPIINVSPLLVVKTLLVLLSVAVANVLLIRVTESRADAFAHKVMGERAYELLVKILRMNYGKNVRGTEDAPLFSRITHTSSRNALKTGDPLSSLNTWEFPAILTFVTTTIGILNAGSINIIELFPLLYVGILVANFILGLAFLPVVKKYYGMTERGSTNFSFLLAGLYIFSSAIALDGLPNIYLAILLFSLGITLTSVIARTFLKSWKVILYTLSIYLAIIALVSVIRAFVLRGV